VVIPVYNEPRWIGTVVDDVCAAIARAPFRAPEIVVVDDGSGPETRAALAALSPPVPLRVLRQGNAGRFAARRTGVTAAHGDLVLLIDSRVSIRPNALAFVAERLPAGSTPVYWNAHVDIEVAGNPYARFWNVLTEAAFAEYFRHPRTTSFGLEEFDRFPKGTTCFLAPRADLLWAMDRFSSYYADPRDANDDTILIRSLAERARINISPGFSCLYRARDTGARFLRHTHHRGVVFVDGHLRRGARFAPAILAFLPLSLLAAAAALRHPRRALALAPAAPLAAGAAGVALRRPPRDVLTLAWLGPVWAAAYGAGIWRGVAQALAAAWRRRRGAAS
jgi:glycosyltransferase involved in cell wall biosynthesis